jgi:hypothetical protein
MGIHLLHYAHWRESFASHDVMHDAFASHDVMHDAFASHDVMHDAFASIIRDVGFHVAHK